MTRAVRLGEVVSLADVRIDPSRLGDATVEHFSLPAFDTGLGPQVESAAAIKSQKNAVTADAVLVSKLNPNIPRVWLPGPGTDSRARLASTEFLVLRPDGQRIQREYLYHLCKSALVSDVMVAAVTGTSTSHQRVMPADFLNIEVTLPSLEAQGAIAGVLQRLEAKVNVDREAFALSQQLLASSLAAATEVEEVPLATVAVFENRRRIPLSRRERAKRQGRYPYYGATGVIDHIDGFLFDGTRTLVGEDGARVALDDGTPIVQLVSGKFWVNNHAHVLCGEGISTPLLAAVVRRSHVRHLVTGSAQPKLSMGNLQMLKVVVPTGDQRAALDRLAVDTFALQVNLLAQMDAGTALYQGIAPGLLSGSMRMPAGLRIDE